MRVRYARQNVATGEMKIFDDWLIAGTFVIILVVDFAQDWSCGNLNKILVTVCLSSSLRLLSGPLQDSWRRPRRPTQK